MVSQATFRLGAFIILCSLFAAFASYRLHLEPFLDLYATGLEGIIEGVGRAPDQYRYLPYIVLDLIRDAFTMARGEDIGWKWPVVIFETIFLSLGLVCIISYTNEQLDKKSIILITTTMYPFVMFDGVRSIASFIFFMSSLLLLISKTELRGIRKPIFYVVLLAFAFTRADVAILVGLIAAYHLGFRLIDIMIVAAIPILIQYLLMQHLFPSSEYYSELIMLKDNVSFVYIAGNPLTYLIIGLVIAYWEKLNVFSVSVAKQHWFPLLLCVGYLATVIVVGRVNEYRLFFPLLPIFWSLWPLKIQPRV